MPTPSGLRARNLGITADSASPAVAETVVSIRYHAVMGMTLRTSAEQTQALRRQAAAEGRSMQAVALSAIDEYIARRTHKGKVAAALQRVLREEAGVLKRLKDA
jgi:predicted transcriptional regulator